MGCIHRIQNKIDPFPSRQFCSGNEIGITRHENYFIDKPF